MPLLELTAVNKSFGGVPAVRGVSLGAEAGEIVCLLGPSGCGKTTLLRLIAGLEAPDTGSIAFDGRVIDGLPPQERGFGLMFQDLALFPTWTSWATYPSVFGCKNARKGHPNRGW